MNFTVIRNDDYAVRKAGYKLDLSNHCEKLQLANDKCQKYMNGFFDLDGASLCLGEDGQLYAVEFDVLAGTPRIWCPVILNEPAMLMNDQQLYTYLGEAENYDDQFAYVSDVATSVYDTAGVSGEIDSGFIEQVSRLWNVARLPVRELLPTMGLTQTGCSRKYCIPLKTVQHWCALPNADYYRECPIYIRLMLAEVTGYLKIR